MGELAQFLLGIGAVGDDGTHILFVNLLSQIIGLLLAMFWQAVN